MKKIIGILIAVAILATCVATTAFAAAGTISVSTKTIEVSEAGNEVTLVVKNAEPITSFTMSLTYDSALQLVRVQNGGVAGSSFNSKGDNVVGWAAAEETYPAGSTLFTATFKIKEGVVVEPGKTYAVGLTIGSNGAIGGADRTEVPLDCVKGGIKINETVTPPAHEHAYNKYVKTVAPTCKDGGYDVYACECGEQIQKNHKPATGKHTYVAVDHKDATCGKDGYTTYKCSGCGATYTETHKATGKHSYKEVARVAATCEKDGYVTYKCSGCGHTYNETLKATGHNAKEVARKAPTCTENGYITYKCFNCGASYNEVIKATGHKVKEVARKAPTCTQDGYITYKCSGCGVSHNEVLKATGHNFLKNGKYVFGSNETSHWYICHTCGAASEAVKHEHDQEHDGYKWCVCGHKGDPIKKPSTGDIDDVPQTGDITGYVTFGAFAMISMAAAAAYVVTRKFAKK